MERVDLNLDAEFCEDDVAQNQAQLAQNNQFVSPANVFEEHKEVDTT